MPHSNSAGSFSTTSSSKLADTASTRNLQLNNEYNYMCCKLWLKQWNSQHKDNRRQGRKQQLPPVLWCWVFSVKYSHFECRKALYGSLGIKMPKETQFYTCPSLSILWQNLATCSICLSRPWTLLRAASPDTLSLVPPPTILSVNNGAS